MMHGRFASITEATPYLSHALTNLGHDSYHCFVEYQLDILSRFRTHLNVPDLDDEISVPTLPIPLVPGDVHTPIDPQVLDEEYYSTHSESQLPNTQPGSR